MLAPKNRAYLKGLANHLKPTLNLGKGDIDENIVDVLNKALEANEIVKIRLLDTVSSTPEEIIDEFCLKTGAQLVGKCGHIITFYRESKKNKRIVLPR